MHCDARALCTTRFVAGMAIETSTAMMQIVTKSSMSVKAALPLRWSSRWQAGAEEFMPFRWLKSV
jgi:hypothetical protein